jgi:methylase of polypeptide subunit release factors
MPLNANRTDLWKEDISRSIDFYNRWFIEFAPSAYQTQRAEQQQKVKQAFEWTQNLTHITPDVLRAYPSLLPVLRMACAPPLARDRLMGLAYASKSLIAAMEGREDRPSRIPPRFQSARITEELSAICDVIQELVDRDLFTWLNEDRTPASVEIERAVSLISDRLCGFMSDPIIRNAQERRQLETLTKWLHRAGYKRIALTEIHDPSSMPAGTYAIRLTLKVGIESKTGLSVDCAIQPWNASPGTLPLLIEAKSAGDATNTNKRRKEEAQKLAQLKRAFGNNIVYVLLLCGYFDSGYLGYEASEGIDWIWEHRITDLAALVPSKRKVGFAESPAIYDTPISHSEAQRVEFQTALDSRRDSSARNRLGQYATPYALARSIVSNAVAQLDVDAPIHFLEPSLGTGAFFSAMSSVVEEDKIAECVGVEIDTEFANASRSLWQSSKHQVLHSNFFDFAQQKSNFHRFNLLCANPPYTRHHHIPANEKIGLQAYVKHRFGIEASGLSGLYLYFIFAVHDLLADGAIASWLIPTEFLSVNYGKSLREYLRTEVSLIEIKLFDPANVQFDDALVSSCVLTYEKTKPKESHTFLVSVPNTDTCDQSVEIKNLSSTQKWNLLNSKRNFDGTDEQVKLGDLFDVRRGIATGNNAFFILAQARASELGLPLEFLRPILPAPRQIKERIITADQRGLPDNLPKYFLLDCILLPEVIQKRHPMLWAYLQTGVAQGVDQGYLCQHRDCWYFQEKRSPALYMATYMGRSNDGESNPTRFFLNQSQAIGTNVFLHLYPKPFVMRLLENNIERQTDLLASLEAISLRETTENGRVYGGGLHKTEPSEMKSIPIRQMPAWLSQHLAASPHQLALMM